MLNSKWFHFSSAALVSIFGVAASLDWSSVISAPAAGKVIAAIGVGKMILSAVTPPATA